MYYSDDLNHLHGTPIPETWTRNLGANLRPLEVGMEIRYADRSTRRFVVSASWCGASVAASSTAKYGDVISNYAEVEYRRAADVVQVAARKSIALEFDVDAHTGPYRAAMPILSVRTCGWPHPRYFVQPLHGADLHPYVDHLLDIGVTGMDGRPLVDSRPYRRVHWLYRNIFPETP